MRATAPRIDAPRAAAGRRRPPIARPAAPPTSPNAGGQAGGTARARAERERASRQAAQAAHRRATGDLPPDAPALSDAVALSAAGAAILGVLAFAGLPSLPAGLALLVACVPSVALGAIVMRGWMRRSTRAGVRDATWSRATPALVAAHAVAAVPLVLALLLAA